METKILIAALVMTGGLFMTSVLLFSAARYRFFHPRLANDLPTVYKYFRSSTANVTGLQAEADGFRLNGKKLKIISGAMHYFRIHPALWRDRIKKLRAMGANTLETYVPWQLHEPSQGRFDFGEGDNDMSMFLNIRRYIQIAQEEDLLVLLRPGPYICSEWDFGGLPSWLLRDPDMKVRTSYQPYLERVKIYFHKLLPLLADLQFTRGGPIIGIQIENEYASFNAVSKDYLEFLYALYEYHGFTKETLLFTSDAAGYGDRGTLPEKLLMTANFFKGAEEEFKMLQKFQPNKPSMAMEVWVGWFDHWLEEVHNDWAPPHALVESLVEILGKCNASVNLYMFHGGTNFGFMAGANADGKPPYYHADVTSYDYAAPLSEAGDYTLKYRLAKTIIELYQEPKIKVTEMISETRKIAYPPVTIDKYLTYNDLLAQVPQYSKFSAVKPIPMENLEMNDGNGQSYGYIVYRKRTTISSGVLEVGPVRDFGILLVNEKFQQGYYHDYWIHTVRNFTIKEATYGEHIIDLLIENTGRINYGNDVHFRGQKGLDRNAVYKLNGQDISQTLKLLLWSSSQNGLTKWRNVSLETLPAAPVLFQATLDITGEVGDTFLDMTGWHKGIVFVNGFNIGRYFIGGPQKTLFVPGPLLHPGKNKITIFEQFKPASRIEFKDKPNLGSMTIKEKVQNRKGSKGTNEFHNDKKY